MHSWPRTTLRAGAVAGLLALAVHGLFVLLLVLEDHDLLRPLPPSRQLAGMWIHLPPPDLPAQVVEPEAPAPQSLSVAPRPRTSITLAPGQAVVPQPPAPEAGNTPDVEPAPPKDWELAAERLGGNYGREPPSFGPPLQAMREACKPHRSSMWPKKAAVEDAPPAWNQPIPHGGVKMGGARVGVMGGGIAIGGPKPQPNSHLFDYMKSGKTPLSSVPDPNVCD